MTQIDLLIVVFLFFCQYYLLLSDVGRPVFPVLQFFFFNPTQTPLVIVTMDLSPMTSVGPTFLPF